MTRCLKADHCFEYPSKPGTYLYVLLCTCVKLVSKPFLSRRMSRRVHSGDSANPDGKLRLLYECAPMAFIAEQCGGAGSTGRQRVLDVKPDAVNQRTPFFTGSPKEVEYLESFLTPQ